MPIYEEKVISPFAIHFTQEHIKTHFQDGRVVEETVADIQTTLSDGHDYDIILKAPFPNIEILRWQPPHCDEEARNWFTLDNRRLYCLQRMAAEHWPKRVGAVVDILYADTGRVRKKYDSTTEGRSVTISPSVKVPALRRWDWRVQIGRNKLLSEDAALTAVKRDCEKPNVSDLCNVPGPAFEATLKVQTADFVSSLAALLTTRAPEESSPTESTAASEAPSREATPREAVGRRFESVCREITKPGKLTWKVKGAEKSEESLEEEVIRLVREQLSRPEGRGFVWIEQWNERYRKDLGNLRAFLESKKDIFVVKPGKGRSYRVEVVAENEKPSTSGKRWKKGLKPIDS